MSIDADSRLRHALASGRFVVTSELTPPKGVNLEPLLARARRLAAHVDAINVTDCHGARMAMAPMAAARPLIDEGIEPVLQLTTRDRNRLALQSDLLGAWSLGVRNVVFMGGDPPANGDHPDAKPVFDVYASLILRAASDMSDGRDMAGNPLDGSLDFCLGAVVNPGAADLDDELRRMEEKRAAGATFFQTQAVFDARAFERFVRAAEAVDAPLLAGIVLLKSAKMARWLNDSVPGIEVPAALVEEIAATGDRATTSVEIAARVLRRVRPLCAGAHVMAIGWEELIPAVLEAAELGTHETEPDPLSRSTSTM